jgi:hypothetical protein
MLRFHHQLKEANLSIAREGKNIAALSLEKGDQTFLTHNISR